MAYARFGPIDIRVRSITESGEEIADTGRTAGGKERRDYVADKRAWEVTTPPMPLSWVQNFLGYLRTIGWGYDDWWCRDLGPPANTVRARIDRASWSATSIDDLPGYRIVSFRVIEQ